MKTIFATLILTMSLSAPTLYDFKINALDGRTIDFARYKGKALLIVNTASRCGYTPQYADLQELHKTYGNQIFAVKKLQREFPPCWNGSSSHTFGTSCPWPR